MTLLDAVRDFCVQLGLDRTYWIAYSGGLDSEVLLSLFAALRENHSLSLRAIHINHGLSRNAVAWSKHCAAVCETHQIPFYLQELNLSIQSGESLEERARDERYAAFADLLQPNDVLVTAHHEDDQAETILLQLIRGAGVKGLAAMPPVKPFANGLLARPLLSFSRTQLLAYAKEKQLQWIDDESNQVLKMSRNYLRAEIMPLLKKRWPSVSQSLARSAAHCAEAQTLLEEYTNEEWHEVAGSHPNTLSVTKLCLLNRQKQKLVLRHWIQANHFSVPAARKLENICETVLTASADKNPHVTWDQVELRRFRDDLFLMSQLSVQDINVSYQWNFEAPLAISSIGTLKANPVVGDGLHQTVSSVTVRFRQGGEMIRVKPNTPRRELKNLFQEWGVPTWERARVPLIFVGERLAAVVGYCIDPQFAAGKDERGWVVEFKSLFEKIDFSLSS